jgi:hypothetical protein
MGKAWKDTILDELSKLVQISPEALIEQRFSKLQNRFLSLKNMNSF